MNSKARMVRNAASACATGLRPRRASPAAAPISVCSQIPTSTKRGPREAGRPRIGARFSAVITITSSRRAASVWRASP